VSDRVRIVKVLRWLRYMSATAPPWARDKSRAARISAPGLRQAERDFATSFSHAPIGMALVGPTGRYLRVNAALCDLVGYSETELLEMGFQDITHPDDVNVQLLLLKDVLAGRKTRFAIDKRYLHSGGQSIWVSISVSLVRDEDGTPVHLITQVLDITARHERESRLQQLADHDSLTGLLNRRRFEEDLLRQLDRCRRYGERAALAVIDIDNFKDVNDKLGHVAGDQLLRLLADVLRGNVRSSDVVARIGGDEFAVLLLGVGSEDVRDAASSLVEAVRAADRSDDPKITVSVGLTVLQPDDVPDVAFVRADRAMYAAKEDGDALAVL